jgi:RNA-binding protein
VFSLGVNLMALTPKFRQQLKALAHALKPVIYIGQNGFTEAVKKETELALDTHELIKVKIQIKEREERWAILDEICQATQAEKVQAIGQIGVIYRKNK